MRLDIFQPATGTGTGGTGSVTGSSARVTPTFIAGQTAPMNILITNVGTDTLMVEFGDITVTASATTSCTILPNDKQLFNWNPGQSFAVIGVTGSGSSYYWKLGYGA